MKKIQSVLVFAFICALSFCQPNRRPATFNPGSGYSNINELQGGYGLGTTTIPYSRYFYGMTTIHGYQLNIYGLHIKSSLLGGIGAGVFKYNGGTLFPVFGDIRFNIDKKKASPYIFAKSGLLLSFEDLFAQTRMFINGGVGLRFKIDDHIGIHIGTGLFIQMGSNVSRNSFVNLIAGMWFKPDNH